MKPEDYQRILREEQRQDQLRPTMRRIDVSTHDSGPAYIEVPEFIVQDSDNYIPVSSSRPHVEETPFWRGLWAYLKETW